MIYDVRQVTSYTYASKVGYADHVLRLTPVDRLGQRVQAVSLDVEPTPSGRRESKDFFGNRLTSVELDQPHDELTIKVAARVVVEPVEIPETGTTPPWESVRSEVFGSTDISPASPVHFLFPSRQVSLDPEIRDYVRESFPAGRPILDGAIEVMKRIKDDFVYEIGATNASTTPPMSFALRRGVCQDFAHIMISGLRGIGLPAAYISGYLRTAPRKDAVRLEGADAMHAWMAVWCGHEHGWFGLDPTNAILAGEDHVVVAIGRDYSDVAPIDGVVFASGGQQLKVAVSVKPVDPA
jgi:transglutaminase-like putative cysteine protease